MQTPLDDSQLLRLAADPRTPLFSDPSRTAVLAPLVIVLSLLPALAIPLAPQFDETSSRWGLRAIDVAMAQQLSHWLEPGREGFGRVLAYQPPLMSWLTASVVRVFGMDRPASWHGVSLLATCVGLCATYRLARRLGGGTYSLIVVACLACHPLTMSLVTETTPAALGMLLIVVTAWGWLGHLDSARSLASVRLLVSGVAWGLSVLAIGPCAFAVLLPLLLHVILGGGSSATELARSASAPLATASCNRGSVGRGVASLMLLVATGLSFSSWWVWMMLSEHGVLFGSSWWTGSLASDPTSITVSHGERGWLADNALILGWLLVGLRAVAWKAVSPDGDLARSRHRWLGLWWLIAVAARVCCETYGPRESAQRETWEVFLLVPTLLIVGWGVDAVVKRRTSPLMEALLIAATCGLATWRWTDHTAAGVVALALVLASTAILPAVAARWRGNAHDWCERNWRRFLRVFVVTCLVVHLTAGQWDRPRATIDDVALIELRHRLRAIPAVRHITFVTVNEAAPATLRFLFLSHWPAARFTVAESWSGDAQKELIPGSRPPDARGQQSRPVETDLIVEWSRRETRLSVESLADWQTTPVGDPLRYGGRKLALHIVRPRHR